MSLVRIGLPHLYVNRLFQRKSGGIIKFSNRDKHDRDVAVLTSYKCKLMSKDFSINVSSVSDIDVPMIGKLSINTISNEIFFTKNGVICWKMIQDESNIISDRYKKIYEINNYANKYFYNSNKVIMRLISIANNGIIMYEIIPTHYSYHTYNGMDMYERYYIKNNKDIKIVEVIAELKYHIPTDDIVIKEDNCMWVMVKHSDKNNLYIFN